jgi:hypothetical protein
VGNTRPDRGERQRKTYAEYRLRGIGERGFDLHPHFSVHVDLFLCISGQKLRSSIKRETSVSVALKRNLLVYFVCSFSSQYRIRFGDGLVLLSGKPEG